MPEDLGGVLLDALRLAQGALDGLALGPLHVLVQAGRRQAARRRRAGGSAIEIAAASITGPGASTTARSIVFSSSRTLPGQW